MDQLIPGTGSDGFTGIDNLFVFAAVAGVKVIYSLRLISQDEPPIGDLKAVHAQATGHIWVSPPGKCCQLRHWQRAGLACLSQVGSDDL